MIILGLDPGIARTGFGILNTDKPKLFVRCGCITTPKHLPFEDRLVVLADDLRALIGETHPDIAVVEHVFFGSNTKTAMLTAHARGVMLQTLREHHIAVKSLTPLQIKSRLTGYGSAKKEQIQTVVCQQLKLDSIPKPDDAADALAAALTVV